MKVLRHIVVSTMMLAALLGVPAGFIAFNGGFPSGTDAISSATVVIDQPTGAYVVMINSTYHKNTDNLSTWEKFFRGEEIDFLFEDISCMVGNSDAGGTEQAKSFQSRLPENQMSLRTEDMTLLVSKLTAGRFDVVIMSEEVYYAYHMDELLSDDVIVIKGEKL